MAEYYLREDLAVGPASSCGNAEALQQWAEQIADQASPQDVYRNKEGRKTLRFDAGGNSFFLKIHQGIGWGEVFKNLLQARLPVLGASNEYRAIRALEAIGVDTMSVAAYASSGTNPARIQSMIVTDDLVGTVSLEDYCAGWQQSPPPPQVKRRLIVKLAQSARKMHGAGINHRDFYICHFHLDEQSLDLPQLRCHLIDLHRAQIRKRTPRRWQVKDLAGLYFSAMDCGLSRRDILRFLAHYSSGGLHAALGADLDLWREVDQKARRLYQREHGKLPPGPA